MHQHLHPNACHPAYLSLLHSRGGWYLVPCAHMLVHGWPRMEDTILGPSVPFYPPFLSIHYISQPVPPSLGLFSPSFHGSVGAVVSYPLGVAPRVYYPQRGKLGGGGGIGAGAQAPQLTQNMHSSCGRSSAMQLIHGWEMQLVMSCIHVYIFLENAEGLRFIILRRKYGTRTQTPTHTLHTPN